MADQTYISRGSSYRPRNSRGNSRDCTTNRLHLPLTNEMFGRLASRGRLSQDTIYFVTEEDDESVSIYYATASDDFRLVASSIVTTATLSQETI